MLFGIVIYLFFAFGFDDSITNFRIEKNSKIDNLPINETYNYCNNETEDKYYIQCINNYFKQRYDYSNDKIKTDFGIMEDDWTGDCSSSSVFYKNLLNKRNIPNQIVILKHHAFVVVNLEEDDIIYCILDQEILSCF